MKTLKMSPGAAVCPLRFWRYGCPEQLPSGYIKVADAESRGMATGDVSAPGHKA
jgi:hypothetical protein